MTSTTLWTRTLLAVLLTALSSGCWRNAKPAEPRVEPPTIVMVREACITKEEPSEETLIDCLNQGSKPEDCLAQEINVLRAWIKTQIVKCGKR